ncbi:hypothetical protein EPA86_03490 [Litorilituus lipolyticus]|uniref:Uncharacterized protein n=2 Tax=Litorilituus lipolyticus TaxID=2491017 RepID=A0A502L238_9GAMM|nr:hypothetical protein EPA86_03490 [Litorilituus lipolyticus]
MLFLAVLLSCLGCSMFFYFQATFSGLGRKRWALAGLMFGPLAWPMFTMKKRVQSARFISIQSVLFNA